MTRPLATLVLPDGTTILLRKVSVGPKHFYREPHPANAGLWDRIRHPFGRKESIDSHSPVLFLTEKSTGSSFERPAALDLKFVRFEDPGKPMSVAAIGSAEGYTLIHDISFPRREKTMRLNLSVRGKWHEWEVPNPVHGTNFPTWIAPPFPQTMREGDCEFTASGWTTSEYGWSLAGTATYQGKPADHWMIVGKAQDATGNEGDPIAMPLGESAWKVKVSLRIGDRAPLTPDRLVDFGTAKVPADGEQVILSVPAKMQEGQLTFVALVGKGTFAFRDGISAPDEAPIATQNPKYSIVTSREDEDGWRVRGEVIEPTFIMYELLNKSGSQFLSDRLAIKCFANGDVQPLDKGGSTSSTRKLQRIKLSQRFPPGTEVRIRSVRPEVLKKELLVPPPTPAERAAAESTFQKQYGQDSSR